MIIKEQVKKKISLSNSFFKIYFFLSLFLITLFFLIFFNTGIWINNKKNFLNRIYFNGLNNYIHILEIASKGTKGLFQQYDEVNLNIPFENLTILEKNREELIANSKDGKRAQNAIFVETTGSINYLNKKVPIRIRLKGDRDNHYSERDKSSYKITIRGDEKIMGIKKFSFIKPRIRNYIHEWLFHELAEEGNLIKLKYKFINLKFNGNNHGLYVLEEGFDKDLIERNKRRNGPIFSILEEFDNNIFDSKLELYNKNYWNKKENFQLSNYARNRLRNFLDGKLDLKEVFDTEKWAWYFALADLTYTHHGLSARNVKFFYNPVSSLFEPVPYDGHRFLKNYNKNLIDFDHSNAFEMASECLDESINYCNDPTDDSEKWLYSFFYKKGGEINSDFYSKYASALYKITDDKFLSTFFDQRKNQINKINSAIYADYFLIDNITYGKYGPGIYYFSIDDIYDRANTLKKKIEIKLNKISATDNNELILIENNKEPNNLSLVISELACENFKNNSDNKFFIKTDLNINFKKNVQISKNNEQLKNSKCTYIKLKNKFNNKIYTKKINFNLPTKIVQKSIEKKYLKYFYEDNNNLYLINKETTVEEDIFIPSDFIVKIKSGEKITILNNAFIISESAWKAVGKSESIIISGKKNNFGGGLIIKNAKNDSEFYNTKFIYLSGVENRVQINDKFEIQSYVLTEYNEKEGNNYLYSLVSLNKNNYPYSHKFNLFGALNFYNTNIKINNCKFFRIDSEDAVNIISSNFLIENSFFEDNNFDAIDVDFGKGIIKNSHFSNIKNDAVDLSESDIYIENLLLSNIGDKLVSAGENTYVKINKIKATNSYIGIASKDGSESIVKNIDFVEVEIPFASYQKKKSYNYGLLKIDEPINLNKYTMRSIKDPNSKIYINGEKIKKYEENVIKIVTKNN